MKRMPACLAPALCLCCLSCLTGCYTVNNERFAADVRKLVQPGLDLAAATQRLEADGFRCDAKSAAPQVTCTKTRQSLLPTTCIERVNLVPGGAPARVEDVEIPQIACAGL